MAGTPISRYIVCKTWAMYPDMSLYVYPHILRVVKNFFGLVT